MADSMCSDLIGRHHSFTGKLRKLEREPGLRADSVVFIAVCCFIVLESLLVLVTVWRTQRFHKPTCYFIGNLALSDLLAGVVYAANIPLSGANTSRLTATQREREWKGRAERERGSVFVALATSVFSLLAIAIERHLTVLRMGACWCVAGALGGLGWNCVGAMHSCSTVLPLYHKSYILCCTVRGAELLMACWGCTRTSTPWCAAGGCCWSTRLAHWFLALAVLNSAMNPLTSTEMRRAFVHVLTGGGACCRRRPRPRSPAPKAKRPSESENSSHPNREFICYTVMTA
ncbi:hypothetical protein AAFF_G00297970 [Aldrovandia affinis]|uniref:G-protein coupled receptors family 1 profile domain-containing protein n=1 Tax=Aldrovandia affinis TaxID=143900 RepID=A0AAD7W1C4_9TELE|nr:hypothetical protein AAFF_G00297970 [Aldrovandia affinis]